MGLYFFKTTIIAFYYLFVELYLTDLAISLRSVQVRSEYALCIIQEINFPSIPWLLLYTRICFRTCKTYAKTPLSRSSSWTSGSVAFI